MDLIEIWKRRKSEAPASFRKYLNRLQKSKDKKINELANDMHDRVFRELDCLDCANCCSSIPPMLNEMDVKRAAKYLGIRPSEFKEQYLRIDEDLDMVMKSSPCPFLESDNKCLIYDGRPKACREYPHINNHEFLKNIRLHQPNSAVCPAVFHILERMQKRT